MHKIKNSSYHYVYVVFFVTNTMMGKMIQFATRNSYSHVALAFEEDLQTMYSFARYHINSPISGGFVIEHPQRYLNGNRDVEIKLCKVPVSEVDYRRIRKTIDFFCQNKDLMLYNTVNAILSLVNKKIKVENTYTCIEFVTYLLNIRNILAIRDLEIMLEPYQVYHGGLREIARLDDPLEDDYFNRRCIHGIVYDTFSHFGKIILRLAYR